MTRSWLFTSFFIIWEGNVIQQWKSKLAFFSEWTKGGGELRASQRWRHWRWSRIAKCVFFPVITDLWNNSSTTLLIFQCCYFALGRIFRQKTHGLKIGDPLPTKRLLVISRSYSWSWLQKLIPNDLCFCFFALLFSKSKDKKMFDFGQFLGCSTHHGPRSFSKL